MTSDSFSIYTLRLAKHGRIGWRWALLDWGIAVDFGYERTKSAARAKAHEILQSKKQQTKNTPIA
jgi:hypothetical protein